MVEKNKAQKIQNSLHLLDMPKRNQHIHFISNKSELKQPLTARKGTTDEEDGLATGKRLNNERDAYIAQLKSN